MGMSSEQQRQLGLHVWLGQWVGFYSDANAHNWAAFDHSSW
ncbi:hypothetical protein [Archangium violaceum]